MGLINKEIENLKDADILSYILFALFKLHDSNEYSALSELAYILDKDNLFRLCEYFGGLTIRIPTINELETLIQGLLLYKFIDIDNLSLDQAIANLSYDGNISSVKKCYFHIRELLSQYPISARGKL